MPNWCNNGLVLIHKDPAMIERAAKALQEGKFLQEFIPCPAELMDTVADGGTNEAMVAKHGYSSWYEHNINEWGTKWDVNSDNVEIVDANTVSAGFDSAWAPPIRAYEQLRELGFGIEAFYYEPGMGFVGKWTDGEDDCIEYSGQTSETVREMIGEELDDYFAISESMAEWEADNQE